MYSERTKGSSEKTKYRTEPPPPSILPHLLPPSAPPSIPQTPHDRTENTNSTAFLQHKRRRAHDLPAPIAGKMTTPRVPPLPSPCVLPSPCIPLPSPHCFFSKQLGIKSCSTRLLRSANGAANGTCENGAGNACGLLEWKEVVLLGNEWRLLKVKMGWGGM